MRINGYRCDGCGAFTEGTHGDQRDPGPFLPKDWWGSGGLSPNSPTFCPDCTASIKAGELGPKKATP